MNLSHIDPRHHRILLGHLILASSINLDFANNRALLHL
jgi:hypothetical protein